MERDYQWLPHDMLAQETGIPSAIILLWALAHPLRVHECWGVAWIFLPLFYYALDKGVIHA